MLETKSLLCANGTHSGTTSCYVPNKDLIETYQEFFKYMSTTGWKTYKDVKFLVKTINKYAKKCRKLCETVYVNDEGLVDEIACDVIVSKFKGNIFEVICESILRNINNLPFPMIFEKWEGNAANDRGVDGYCHACNNKNFLISIQAKFRTEDTLGWQDGIQKAYVEVKEKMEELRRRKVITSNERDEWADTVKPVVLFTTTDAHWFLKEAAEKWLNIVNEQDLYEMLGMFDGIGHKLFWDLTYKEVICK